MLCYIIIVNSLSLLYTLLKITRHMQCQHVLFLADPVNLDLTQVPKYMYIHKLSTCNVERIRVKLVMNIVSLDLLA